MKKVTKRDIKFVEKLSPAEKRDLLQKLIKEKIQKSNYYPLSFAQQRLWILDQLEPNVSVYNLPYSIHLIGKLDISILRRSIRDVIRRHESLRTTFSTSDGEPVQVISPVVSNTLHIIDLSKLPISECFEKAQTLITEEVEKPFNLNHGPLLRTKLFRLSTKEHIFLLIMHHIICDGWSIGIFLRELSEIYTAYCNNEPSPLPQLTIQYKDFTEWQRHQLKGVVFKKQLSYWKKRLKGAQTFLNLPTDRMRSAIQTLHGNKEYIQVDPDLTQELKTLSQQSGVSLFMTFLSAFATLFYRYSKQEDMIIGVPVANRNYHQVENIIGFFVNVLPIRIKLSPNLTFLELLSQVRENILDDYENQDLPINKIIEEMKLERNLSYEPLVQVSFAFHNEEMHTLNLPGVVTKFSEIKRKSVPLDMMVHLWENSNNINGFFNYNTDLFDNSRISRMIEHFQRLLKSIISEPNCPIATLPLLIEEERRQIFSGWNSSKHYYSNNLCVHQIFETQVEATPGAIALIYEDKQLMYRELNYRANQLAYHLQSVGVGPEVLAGIYVDRSFEMIIGILGILKAGGAYLPLDSTYPRERLEFLLYDTKPKIILTQQHLVENLPKVVKNVICLDSDWGKFSKGHKENLIGNTNPTNLAYVIYTSGSTGKPKGTLLEHTGLVNLVKEQIYHFRIHQESRVLQFASLSFDASVSEIFTTLAAGATLCIETKESLQPGRPLFNTLRDLSITTVTLPPSVLSTLPNEPLPELRTLVVAGETCSASLISQWSPGRLFINAYGPTEATVCATLLSCQKDDSPFNIGRPISNVKIYILDQNLQPVPIGIPGELHIGGVGLARGYLNRPGMTAEKFIPNPFSKKRVARLYKTGDLAKFMSDGNIEFLGRLDHQVKIRGFRIELGEIEFYLNQHENVRDNIVIAREDNTGNKRLVAYVVSNEENALGIGDLRLYLESKLPNYMIPSAFVFLNSLPLTPNGKVDQDALPEPTRMDYNVEITYIAPQNKGEQAIAAVWQEVLHVKEVSVYDNFFDLGGHSLLLTKVLRGLDNLFTKEITMIDMFKYPTIRLLAEYLNQNEETHTSYQRHYVRAQSRKESVIRHGHLRKIRRTSK